MSRNDGSPVQNPGDDFPADARYGVMCIEGYNDAAGSYDGHVRSGTQYTFRFYVVDTVMCGTEVSRPFVGVGKYLDAPKVQEARRKAQKYASELNRRDRAHDRLHAYSWHRDKAR